MNDSVTLYVLDDGFKPQLMEEKAIRNRAFELSQAKWMPSVEDAIKFLTEDFSETVIPLTVKRDDLLYFVYEVL